MTETGNKLLDGLYSLTKAPEFIKRKAKEYLLALIGPITSATSSGIEEAPIDGTQYGREDGNWTEIITGSFSGDMDDIPDGSTYVKTHNDYTDAEVTKLSGIVAGAEVNVQSDWNEADSGSDAYIANKPTIPAEGWTFVGKTASQSKTNDNTFADDSELFADLDTGIYHLRGFILFYESASPDIKFQFNYTGSTSVYHVGGIYSGADSLSSTSAFGYSSVTSRSITCTVAGRGILRFEWIMTTTSSGRASVQWAQNTSNAGTCSIYGGSYIEYKKVA